MTFSRYPAVHLSRGGVYSEVIAVLVRNFQKTVLKLLEFRLMGVTQIDFCPEKGIILKQHMN